MTDEPTLATITAELAVLRAEVQAFRTQPSLRNCLYPGCLREFDMAARMEGREPARPTWSGDGWHQATRGVSHGSICPDHVDIVTAHMARPIDLPNGRWMVACACDWMSRPQTYGGLLRPLWEEHVLLAAGKLTAPVTLAETPGRLPLADHTDDTLRELYEALEDTDHDRAETYDAAQAMYKAWDWHRHALGGVARAVCAVNNHLRLSQSSEWIDWADNRYTAYVYAVLLGWGCQEQHDHDAECGGDAALLEVAAKHRWDEHRVKYVREMRALLAPITYPQQPKED